MDRTRNPAYGFAVPWVWIPLFPPVSKKGISTIPFFCACMPAGYRCNNLKHRFLQNPVPLIQQKRPLMIRCFQSLFSDYILIRGNLWTYTKSSIYIVPVRHRPTGIRLFYPVKKCKSHQSVKSRNKKVQIHVYSAIICNFAPSNQN